MEECVVRKALLAINVPECRAQVVGRDGGALDIYSDRN